MHTIAHHDINFLLTQLAPNIGCHGKLTRKSLIAFEWAFNIQINIAASSGVD